MNIVRDLKRDLRRAERALLATQVALGNSATETYNLKGELEESILRETVVRAEIEPMRKSINSLTAERSRWLRKLKRDENR